MTDDKMIRIDKGLHQQIKVMAAMRGMSIRALTELALRRIVSPMPQSETADPRTLVDPGVKYETQEA